MFPVRFHFFFAVQKETQGTSTTRVLNLGWKKPTQQRVLLGKKWDLRFSVCLGFFFLRKKYLFICEKFFPDGCNLWAWRNHPQAEKPCLPSPLRHPVPAPTNAGPAQEGSPLGKRRPRISCGVPAPHLSALPFRFRHGADGRVLADHAAALPPAAICRALEESHNNDICPSKPSPEFQKQKGIYEAVLLSWRCTHATKRVNIYIGCIYWTCTGMQIVWNKFPWLDISKKEDCSFLIPWAPLFQLVRTGHRSKCFRAAGVLTGLLLTFPLSSPRASGTSD